MSILVLCLYSYLSKKGTTIMKYKCVTKFTASCQLSAYNWIQSVTIIVHGRRRHKWHDNVKTHVRNKNSMPIADHEGLMSIWSKWKTYLAITFRRVLESNGSVHLLDCRSFHWSVHHAVRQKRIRGGSLKACLKRVSASVCQSVSWSARLSLMPLLE